ncbi:MAG TPA: PhaM family polyhydroxyalkanoate granule multifunctional regulatory protein [Burkholderiales bacterium]|nr:PhaM family polyhydroxyalkanoate granule multifunctional regulatory protein [Burkholderiales bacterium]
MAEDFSKDWVELMQKMWTPMSFPIPGMMTPTVDIAEIDRKIGELRSVENWLKMNLSLLQVTIKTMEMQKAALESLNAGAKKDPSAGS